MNPSGAGGADPRNLLPKRAFPPAPFHCSPFHLLHLLGSQVNHPFRGLIGPLPLPAVFSVRDRWLPSWSRPSPLSATRHLGAYPTQSVLRLYPPRFQTLFLLTGTYSPKIISPQRAGVSLRSVLPPILLPYAPATAAPTVLAASTPNPPGMPSVWDRSVGSYPISSRWSTFPSPSVPWVALGARSCQGPSAYPSGSRYRPRPKGARTLPGTIPVPLLVLLQATLPLASIYPLLTLPKASHRPLTLRRGLPP